MRALTGTIQSYDAPSTEEIARRVGLPAEQIIRFDGNTSPRALPSTRAEALAEELGRIHTYPHGGYPQLERAIADYAGVAPENVVLGAGADDLILLVARSFASPGDRVAIANDPTYPMFPISVWVAGAEIGDDDPVLTICCRPNNPTGELGELPPARPIVVDEAYYEYSGATAVDLIEDDVIVLRTFSKAFGLAGARVGYALAGRELAAELNKRQHPAPLSTLSAALALAGLQSPPDVTPILEERERMAQRLRELRLGPLPSAANFLYVPVDDPQAEYDRLLQRGLAVRPVRGGIRITIRTQQDDDRLLHQLQ
ncbi:MAG TPA: aminotransferase class I/II-fold pyridoxal phosphate-dependent enzyme [Gaiellaceae bacterium]|nr:aminotransferase class I/II-fold pyridoxal phosphate-dependent enzyme [Gaiellaceae bacterium]